ncbi:MAG: translesion error-prone DNA polymerase V autoproteolytic subunit [Sedimentisphaerales bacterium]|nr:translesion error-prone DNA polymerase V autoproteolytic subunit [Sedimentisphaerales bacterium]
MAKTKVDVIYSPDPSSQCRRPLFTASVSAGFPSPADDYIEGQLDLNKHLIKHPAATYFVRVSGDSMIEAGIHSGDILIVDRSLEPRDKNVVIANLDGELTVKRIRIRNKKLMLMPENEEYSPHKLVPGNELEIWGVVTHVIHSL